jgi:hypothetical protein
MVRATRAVVVSQVPLLVEADGEIAFTAARHLEISLLPRALKVFS